MSVDVFPFGEVESADLDLTEVGTTYSAGCSPTKRTDGMGFIRTLDKAGEGAPTTVDLEVTVQTAAAGADPDDHASWIATGSVLDVSDTAGGVYACVLTGPILDQVRLKCVVAAVDNAGIVGNVRWLADLAPNAH